MRDQKLLDLRPVIPQAKINLEISETEEFQNKTLRPIIKFQHDWIITHFTHFVYSHKKDWGSLSNETKKAFLESSLSKNQSLKFRLIGMITAYFTSEELAKYYSNKSEINRRTIQIIGQRILDNLNKF